MTFFFIRRQKFDYIYFIAWATKTVSPRAGNRGAGSDSVANFPHVMAMSFKTFGSALPCLSCLGTFANFQTGCSLMRKPASPPLKSIFEKPDATTAGPALPGKVKGGFEYGIFIRAARSEQKDPGRAPAKGNQKMKLNPFLISVALMYLGAAVWEFKTAGYVRIWYLVSAASLTASTIWM